MKTAYPKNYIKEIRTRRGMSLEDLAQAVGVTNPHISMLELGKRGLSWKMVQRIANALECAPLEIVEGANERPEVKSPSEQQLLASFRNLSRQEQQFFLHVLKSYNVKKK